MSNSSTETQIIQSTIEVINSQFENVSTTQFLTGAMLVFLTTYIAKSWLFQLNFSKKLNLKGPTPYPVLGNFLGILFSELPKYYLNLVKEYGKICLYYEGNSPIIVTSDPDFIKAITIKDFRYFVNRRTFDVFSSFEPFNNFLGDLKDEAWKNLRSIMSAAFTSGKLKNISKHILSCCQVIDKYLGDLVEKEDGILDTQKLYGCFIIDVICTSFFGVAIDTVNNPRYKIPFHVQRLVAGDIRKDPKVILFFLFPKIAKFLINKKMMSLVPQESLEYITQICEELIDDRISGKTVRNDFIQSMLDISEFKDKDSGVDSDNSTESKEPIKNSKKYINAKEMLAQTILFLVAGTDTTDSALTAISFELAVNPEIQDELIKEIDTVLEKHNNELSYEAVNEMTYMNKVIDEAQRMYAPIFVDREATHDYEYNGLEIKKGQIINISLYAVHHDEDLYPEPDKFLPERERPSDYFMPFGNGPRSCIASRFIKLEIKLLLASILSKYRFEKCHKTVDKIKINNSGLGKSADPIYLKIVKRF